MAEPIRILLVDDIAEVRENVKKLLAFEQDFDVVGSSGSGRDGIRMARELKPDIIIMDINMPDMDGIAATAEVTRALPTTGVIMMSVNSDRDYMRRAMSSGAKDFLTKPVNMDDLYGTIRSVYKNMKPIRDQYARMNDPDFIKGLSDDEDEDSIGGNRAGHIIVCFSPKGGVGTTTIATNLASGLMRQNIKVLLVDADIQFGDVDIFLNLQAQSTLVDMIDNASDLDVDYFENIVVTHPSGIKVLLGPSKPEFAEQVYSQPEATAEIIKQVRHHYDFIVVDTASRLDELTVAICDIATQILLVTTPTLPAVRNARHTLDLFDQLYEQNTGKIKIVLSKVLEERRGKPITVPREKISKHLRRDIYASIPSEERPLLQAIIKGTPVIAAERNQDRSPVKELLALSNKLRADLMGVSEEEEQAPADTSSSGGFLSRLPGLGS